MDNRRKKITHIKLSLLSGLSLCLLIVIFIGLERKADLQTPELKSYKPELIVQTGHSRFVSSVLFSPDGKLLASSDNFSSKLWDISAGKELREVPGLPVSFTSDSRSLIIQGENGSVLLNVATGKEKFSSKVSGTLSRDRKIIVARQKDDLIKVWSAETEKQLNSFRGQLLNLSPDSKQIATVGEIEKLNEEQVQKFNEIINANSSLPELEDRNDNSIKIWSAETGEKIQELHGNLSKPDSLTFSDDGKVLVSTDREKLKVWDLTSGKLINTLKEKIIVDEYLPLKIDPTNNSIAFFRGDDPENINLAVWDINADRVQRIEIGKRYKIEYVFNNDGNSLVTIEGNRYSLEFMGETPEEKNNIFIRLWDVKTGKNIKTLENKAYSLSAKFSSDGTRLAITKDQKIELWDSNLSQKIKTLEGVSNAPDNVSLSSDGENLALSNGEKTMIWSLKDEQNPKILDGHYSNRIHERYLITPDHSTASAPASSDRTDKKGVTLWDVATGKKLKSFPNIIHWYAAETDSFGPEKPVRLRISPDLKTLAISHRKNVQLWDLSTQKVLWKSGTPSDVKEISFSENGKLLSLGGDLIDRAEIKNIKTGENILSGDTAKNLNSGQLTADGKYLILCSDSGESVCTVWQLTGNRPEKLFPVKNNSRVLSNEKFYTINDFSNRRDFMSVEIWEISTNKLLKSLKIEERSDVSVSPGGKYLASVSGKGITMRDTETGKILWTQANENKEEYFESVSEFNSDGTIFASGAENAVNLWDVRTGKLLKTLRGHSLKIKDLAFSPVDKDLLAGIDGLEIRIWDCGTGKELRKMKWLFDLGMGATFGFSNDGKTLFGIQTRYDKPNEKIKLWDAATGNSLATKEKEINDLISESEFPVFFAPDHDLLGVNKYNYPTTSLATVNGERIGYKETEGSVFDKENIAEINGTRIRVVSNSSGVELVNTANNKGIIRLYWVGESDWVVLSPDGLFDASEGAQELLHFVLSDERTGYEIIDLEQLKSRFYVPGLLQKVIGGNSLPGINEFAVTLFPAIQATQSAQNPNQIDLGLKNRGGGIGRVEVRLNGSELTNDARTGKNVNARAENVSIPLKIPEKDLRAGANEIEIITWNLEGDLRSRSNSYNFENNKLASARGTDFFDVYANTKPSEINYYAIISGVSDYAGTAMDLRYAAKDAEDMAKALSLAARKYFCGEELANKIPCERMHIRLLSTETDERSQFKGLADVPDFKRLEATKENYGKVFAEVAEKAKPEDVVIVYLSGHGTTIESSQAVEESAFPDMYLYPTKDASSIDYRTMVNKSERDAKTVSSLELADWVNKFKAERKVLIVDTCAAGAILGQKNRDPLQIRSLDRFRERTGFFVLMGSSSDAVSFESNKYRQGLLTYSLIEGMTTDEFLQDGLFLDVEKWFGYAENKVSELARGIGGVQKPMRFNSKFAKSFAVGRIETAERNLLPLAQAVPLILQPTLYEKNKFTDGLRLTEKLERKLLEQSIVENRGDPATINFIKATKATNGLSPRGAYTINEDGTITAEIALIMDEKEIEKIKVTAKKEEIIEKLLAEIVRVSQVKS